MNEQTVDMKEIDAQIDAWAEKTKAMTGKVCWERQPWNTEVTADAIRHFAYGTDDDNPLWTDPEYAKKAKFGRLQAPPAFLFSVLYPMLHGAPMKAPLASLIGGLECEWHKRVFEGDTLHPEPRQKRFFEKRNKEGRRLNFVISEVTYRNQNQEVVVVASGTMIMATQIGTHVMMKHEIPYYSEEKLAELEGIWRAEERRGTQPRYVEDVRLGDEVPPLVRGPLTIGDMVAWNAAIGPSYKAGRRGYLDLTGSMHTAMVNPLTGFPVKYSQQHEDFHMAAGRGMPAPFDNGVMRFAWVAPLLTNWIGDDGFVKRLYVQVKAPLLYGDLVTYSGRVTEVDEATGTVALDITGTKPEGQVTTAGSAEVMLPHKSAR